MTAHTAIYTVIAQEGLFALSAKDAILQTPGKLPLALPSKPLAEALCAEWQAHGKFSAGKMVLTSLAYTAIDQVGPQNAMIIEALMTYVDTDTLSYRATGSEKLSQQQSQEWDPLLAWAEKKFGVTWAVTSGVMPIEQPEPLHNAVSKYLAGLSPMHLAAACLLSSALSSLVLMVAVVEKHIDGAEAFRLSRLEEESQAEVWGRDSEADARARKLKDEIISAAHFLDLLDRQ